MPWGASNEIIAKRTDILLDEDQLGAITLQIMYWSKASVIGIGPVAAALGKHCQAEQIGTQARVSSAFKGCLTSVWGLAARAYLNKLANP